MMLVLAATSAHCEDLTVYLMALAVKMPPDHVLGS